MNKMEEIFEIENCTEIDVFTSMPMNCYSYLFLHCKRVHLSRLYIDKLTNFSVSSTRYLLFTGLSHWLSGKDEIRGIQSLYSSAQSCWIVIKSCFTAWRHHHQIMYVTSPLSSSSSTAAATALVLVQVLLRTKSFWWHHEQHRVIKLYWIILKSEKSLFMQHNSYLTNTMPVKHATTDPATSMWSISRSLIKHLTDKVSLYVQCLLGINNVSCDQFETFISKNSEVVHFKCNTGIFLFREHQMVPLSGCMWLASQFNSHVTSGAINWADHLAAASSHKTNKDQLTHVRYRQH